jgi:hypothetical protein
MKNKIVFALLMGIITTGLISLVLIYINTDVTGIAFLLKWLTSWVIAYILVIPCIILISPIVQSMVDKWMYRSKHT